VATCIVLILKVLNHVGPMFITRSLRGKTLPHFLDGTNNSVTQSQQGLGRHIWFETYKPIFIFDRKNTPLHCFRCGNVHYIYISVDGILFWGLKYISVMRHGSTLWIRIRQSEKTSRALTEVGGALRRIGRRSDVRVIVDIARGEEHPGLEQLLDGPGRGEGGLTPSCNPYV
jgi:hypothetical protein